MPHAWLLTVAAFVEAVTGIALLVMPNEAAQLLLDQGLSDAGVAVARLTGIALLALGVTAWVGRFEPGKSAALTAMLVYNILAAIYLAYLCLFPTLTGKLLWPAVLLHLVLAIMFISAWFRQEPGA